MLFAFVVDIAVVVFVELCVTCVDVGCVFVVVGIITGVRGVVAVGTVAVYRVIVYGVGVVFFVDTVVAVCCYYCCC